MTDQYAVMGNPIAHSKSPSIHKQFAEQTGQSLEYTAILVEKNAFPQAVDEFQSKGGKGLNITVPFKEEAWHCVTERSKRAELAGAVNTIVFHEDGTRFGDNTDGAGLINDIVKNNHGQIAGHHILVVGAGGATRGIVGPLLDEKPAQLVIANRTAERAVLLAEQFLSIGNVRGCGLNQLGDQKFDVVINATAASLQGELPSLPENIFATDGWCYDLMYGADPTPFMQWSKQQGAVVMLDGLGMLVEQAAESFYLWRGVRPETGQLLSSLRDALRN